MNKTIFITSCHPLISRNIISTGILSMLKKENIKTVLIVPESKRTYFAETFPEAIVEGVSLKQGKREGLMKYLSLAALNTVTLDIKRKTEMNGSGLFISKILSNKIAFAAIRLLERYSSTPAFGDLFKKYSPTSVFCTDIQNEVDIALLNHAKKQGVKAIGMVRSWDNLTSKGLIRTIPDQLIVWNEIVKKEAVQVQNIDQNIISIIGIPHYDMYKTVDYTNRQAYFEKIGGDPQKKMALFVPIGDRYLKKNTVDRDIVDILDKTLPDDFQILVRLPPGDYVRELEHSPQFSRIKVLYDRAQTNPDNIKTTEIRKEDDIHLAQTLFFSDLVVSGPSTMVIDAAYMDKPTILFSFDGYQKRDYYDSIRRYYDYNNFVPIIESKGVKFATSLDEFKKDVADYHIDAKLIQNLAREQVGFLDGKSTERLFSILKA